MLLTLLIRKEVDLMPKIIKFRLVEIYLCYLERAGEQSEDYRLY